MDDKPAQDGVLKTIGVTLAVCLVCSIFVSVATVVVRPRRLANERAEQQRKIQHLLAREPAMAAALGDVVGASIEEQVVDLATGEPASQLVAAEFDALKAARDPATGVAIAPEHDLAGIKRRARHAVVITVRRGAGIEAVVLPVYGRGYASIIHGHVALARDGNTVVGLTIHSHGETPGLGSEITAEAWRQRWSGKKVRDAAGAVRIGVSFETATPDDAPFTVEAISGATVSSEAVANMLRYWLGDDGFGPLLAKLRTEVTR